MSAKYTYAVWRRKRSTAIVKMFPKGTWKYTLTVWEKTLTLKEYFGGHKYLIEDAMYPFTVLDPKSAKTYDAEIIIRGWWLMW